MMTNGLNRLLGGLPLILDLLGAGRSRIAAWEWVDRFGRLGLATVVYPCSSRRYFYRWIAVWGANTRRLRHAG